MHWKRVAGFDPGYNDETAFVIGAIDPKDGCVYIYDDYYMRERGVSFHAKEIRKRVSQLSFYQPIQADPSVRKRNDRDGISYANYFYKISKIMLEPGNNDILYGIEKIRDYLFNGKLKFFNNCTNLKKEGSMYVYTKNKNTNSNDKPVDKNNHLMDALRYLVARLPRDPNEMSLVYVQSEQSMSRGAFLTSIEDDEDIGMEENVFGGITL
jgi:phage terminase large subunit